MRRKITKVMASLGIELYIKYSVLRTHDLGHLLTHMSQIYRAVYAVGYLQPAQDPEATIRRGWANEYSRFFGRYPEADLAIDTAITGQSIRFRTTAKRWPGFAIANGDIFLELPDKAWPALVGTAALLSVAVTGGMASMKSYWDQELARRDVIIRDLEIKTRQHEEARRSRDDERQTLEIERMRLENRKLALEVEELQRKFEAAPPSVHRKVNIHVSEFGRFLRKPEIQQTTLQLYREEDKP
jgi:hypothetical protein